MCIALLSSAYALPTPYGQPDNVYSADVYGSTMFMSGWITAADVGPDQLLSSPIGEVAPSPIAFTNGNPYATYHLADPSVVAGPNGSLLMFATALDNDDATASGEGDYNQTALLTSRNGGASWTFDGIVIGQDNGFNRGGAWSPSALDEGGRVQLWYGTGNLDTCTGLSELPTIITSTM